MKKGLFICFAICISSGVNYAQTGNTNPYPTSGYLGLGTGSTTPQSKLHISAPARFNLRLYADGNTSNYLSLWQGSSGAGIDPINTGLLYLGYDQSTNVIIGNAGGNLGIGTSYPQSGLHINAPARFNLRLYADGNTSNYLSLWQGSGGAAIDPINTGLLYLGYDQSTNVVIGNAGGNLGIGTDQPQEKLHVEGNVYLGTNQLQFLSASGGNNRIQSAGGSGVFGTWTFKSRFDHLILDAGENSGNERKIIFKTGGLDRMLVDSYGNVGIGTINPTQKLEVNGTIYSREVKVDLAAGTGPDYVFSPNYKLLSLEEIKNYIDQHKHLPEVPSAIEMETNGVNVSEMNMLLLKKIEELTLHVIELKNENDRQNKIIQELTANKK